MNILYGLASEGMGHATRSKVVIERLRSKGHRVLVATAGRAAKLLGPNDMIEIVGLVLQYNDGALDFVKTVIANMARMQFMLQHQAEAFRYVDGFAPEAVVTDLEPFATFYASTRGLPLVSVGNHGIVTRCENDPNVVGATCDPGIRGMIWLAEPTTSEAVVTTIAPLPVKPEYRTTLVPPILRSAAIEAKSVDGEHVVVYQTSGGDSRLIDALNAQSVPFIVYGLNRDAQIGNVQLKPFSERGFLQDLASARAVIANGGYSLTSEAVALGKPIYSIPVRNHFEQVLNGRYVKALGFGDTAEYVEARGVAQFLERTPEYARTLCSMPRHDSNQRLYGTLDRLFPANVSTW